MCPEIFSTTPDLYFCSKIIFVCPRNYILCHRNIFNLPGFFFHCPDFNFCSPKTFLCSAEIDMYPPEFYLLPRKYLVHPIYCVTCADFFDSGHFGKAMMPWLLNDLKPAASALYTEFQTQAFSDILLNSTNDNTMKIHHDGGRRVGHWHGKTAQETSTGHGNSISTLVIWYTFNLNICFHTWICRHCHSLRLRLEVHSCSTCLEVCVIHKGSIAGV